MKGTIKITITRKDNGVFWTEVEAEHCKKKDITFAGLLGAMSLVVNDVKKDIPDSDKAECAKAFGEMMGQMLLGMLQGKTITQRKFEGREAAFISELMKRQGEAQNE